MSDQDFFFDDDEAPAQKPADKASSKDGATRKEAPAPAARPAKPAPAGGQSVTMTVAALIGVVALLVGVIVGIMIPTGGSQPSMPEPAPMSDPGQARPLSPEELGGDLPPGHPEIDGMDGGMPETVTPDPDAPADGGETE